MNEGFKKAFAALNEQQKKAVENIDGPVLVIAGPGTGKTQLIGTRVGYILNNTDVDAASILLLTFTEAGVQEMRERLELLIPDQASKVYVSTYHGFGNDLIKANPEYFEGLEGEALDELGAHTLLSRLIEDLPYDNPLKSGSYYLWDITKFISEAKRALLTPEDISQIAANNKEIITAANKDWRLLLDQLSRVSKKSLPVFEKLLEKLNKTSSDTQSLAAGVRPLTYHLQKSLAQALDDTNEAGKTTPLSLWKRKWLSSNNQGQPIISGLKDADKLAAATNLYKDYQEALTHERLYDYDDMILNVVKALEDNPEFKYSMAERYGYIMLDEFQDTNPAQLRMIELLSDHPVHEGRPNIMAVGDDDQAIYAFQGAEHANMAVFARLYRDVLIISLKHNYRSGEALVKLGQEVSGQIAERLQHSFEGISKELVAAGKQQPMINARQFKSDAAEYEWVAAKIEAIIKKDHIAPNQIAVIAPKHKYLRALLPYLARRDIDVAYDQRQNIWDNPKIKMIEQVARLILALAESNDKLVDALWSEVISYDFWQISTKTIWKISWQARTSSSWTNLLMGDKTTKNAAEFILRLKDVSQLATLEQMLDAILGLSEAQAELKLPMRSPFYDYYFGEHALVKDPIGYIHLLSDLSLLRARIRERQRRYDQAVRLEEFIKYADDSRAAAINVLNTSPYSDSPDSVNLLTAYGSKGREFDAVFVLAAQSEVWGNASRSRSGAIKLPANLEYISYHGMSEDERLRLFYVAVTRSKKDLNLSSHTKNMAGQYQKHLEFMKISEDETGWLYSHILPAGSNKIILDEAAELPVEAIEDYWGRRHLPKFKRELTELLAPRLKTYKLSATHLNNFTDVERHGPNYFFIHNLLQFPQAPSPTSAFGTAIHSTLSFIGKSPTLPTLKKVLERFEQELAGGWLNDDEKQRLQHRGQKALTAWMEQRAKELSSTNKYEERFSNAGVTLGNARLTGNIDRLIIDPRNRTICVVDIKTGRAYDKWQGSVTKLHKFRQQLMFYKLLVEGSSTYRGYKVDRGIIEFIESEDGIIDLPMEFEETEMKELQSLILTVWKNIQGLILPDIGHYPASLKGIRAFEADLTKK